VVVHAPTHDELKGSKWVEEACGPLAEKGLVEFRALRRIAPEDMPRHIADADIVLDQFAIGDYGALACQAMAAGRCVVGHVSEAVRGLIPGPLPIVEARGPELSEVLERLLGDRERAMAAGADGRRYTQRFHDGRYAAMQLAPWLGIDWDEAASTSPA
jgi:glycosyltransferase involved in cell wall biosynthesis